MSASNYQQLCGQPCEESLPEEENFLEESRAKRQRLTPGHIFQVPGFSQASVLPSPRGLWSNQVNSVLFFIFLNVFVKILPLAIEGALVNAGHLPMGANSQLHEHVQVHHLPISLLIFLPFPQGSLFHPDGALCVQARQLSRDPGSVSPSPIKVENKQQ